MGDVRVRMGIVIARAVCVVIGIGGNWCVVPWRCDSERPPVIIVGVTGHMAKLVGCAGEGAIGIIGVGDGVPLAVSWVDRVSGHRHLTARVVGIVGGVVEIP